MLITFRCRSYANVTMFGDIALVMIKMMGHSGTVPGSISAQDVPDALSKLTSALSAKNAAEENLPTDVDVDEEEEQAEPAVSLGRRAFPLIELLKSAIKEECEVMWDNQ
ncbi:DUF1840 domain-containing protein [Vibrio parahaemolyticus]|nr:DUF1840 domain-containing protein [Vibrio parahaemolyticus]